MKCVILAGGSGERLWPLSRTLTPKSLLKLYGKKTLIQNAYKLANLLAKDSNIITVTNVAQLTDTTLQLKEVCKKPVVISEPIAKNTAPAIASALKFLEGKRDEIVMFLPVDFVVESEELFVETVEKAKNLARAGYITAIGVKPEYPETGFGYIEIGNELKHGYKIEKFTEKPDYNTAVKYIESGKYFWNCGIYISKISVFLKAIEKYAPSACFEFSKDMFDENNKIKYRYYEHLKSDSIDYAVIEKTDNTACVELLTSWYDTGSFEAIYDHSKKDKHGNVILGNVITDNVKQSYIQSTKELVAVSGVENTIVVETEDAVLVCDKSRSREINKIVKALKNVKNETVTTHKTVFRPWGFYTCLNGGYGWLSKVITVSPGHKLSLQSHNHRSEHWVVLEGCATVILNDEVHTLNKAQSINIPVKAKHSLQNHTKEILKILEVQKGDYIGEDDIIRYEDMYGRVN